MTMAPPTLATLTRVTCLTHTTNTTCLALRTRHARRPMLAPPSTRGRVLVGPGRKAESKVHAKMHQAGRRPPRKASKSEWRGRRATGARARATCG